MNQQYALNLFEKNTSYAFTLANINSRVSDKEYPAIILVNIDNFNYYKTRKPILHFQLKDQEGHIENEMYNSYHIIVENCLRKRYNKGVRLAKLGVEIPISNPCLAESVISFNI